MPLSETLQRALTADLTQSALPRSLLDAEILWQAICEWYCPLAASSLAVPLFFVLDTGFGFAQGVSLDPQRGAPEYRQALQAWLQRLLADTNLQALYQQGPPTADQPWYLTPLGWQARRALAQAAACVLPLAPSGQAPLPLDPADLNKAGARQQLARIWSADRAIAQTNLVVPVVEALQILCPAPMIGSSTESPGRPVGQGSGSPLVAWIGDVVRASAPEIETGRVATQAGANAVIDLPAVTGFRSTALAPDAGALHVHEQPLRTRRRSEAQPGRPPTEGYIGIHQDKDYQHALPSELAKGADIFTLRYMEHKLLSLQSMRREYKPLRVILMLSIDASPETLPPGPGLPLRNGQSLCREGGGVLLQDALRFFDGLLAGSRPEWKLEIDLDACVLSCEQTPNRAVISQSAVLLSMAHDVYDKRSLQARRHLAEMAEHGWPQLVTMHGANHNRREVSLAEFMQFDAGERLQFGTPKERDSDLITREIRQLFRLSGRPLFRAPAATREQRPYHLAIVISAVHSDHQPLATAVRFARHQSDHILSVIPGSAKLTYRNAEAHQTFSLGAPEQLHVRSLFIARMMRDLERATVE